MAEHKYLNIDGIRYLTNKYDLRYAKASHSHKKSDITDFPTSMPASDVSAWAKAASKPTYTAAEVGLDKVDNTSDEDKPISRAVQAALDGKSGTHNHPYLPLSGGTIEGDLTLRAASGDSPKLKFQRGDATGTITDWNINVVSGALNFNTVATSGSTTEKTIMTLGYSGGLDVVGNIKENGTLLSSKYLGINAKASDSSKLNGQAASYYLDYNNLTNKPNIPSGVTVDTSLSSTSLNAIANKTVKNAIDTIQTDVNTLFTGKSDEGHTHNYLPLSGGTLTGNLTGKYITGTWLQTTAATESSSYTNIAVIDNSGWVYKRSKDNMKSDLGVGQIKIGSKYYIASLSGTTLALTSS